MNRANHFITFEGVDGSGKTTQISLLSNYLNGKNIPHIVTREPGGTRFAEQIRNIVVQNNDIKIDAVTEYLLFSAARRDHVEKVIKPALMQGKWVICDRFYDSSYVYQGVAQNLSKHFLEMVYDHIVEERFRPHLTFVFDVDFQIGLKRTNNRDNKGETRFENKDNTFLCKVQKGFEELCAANKDRCVRIDANLNIEEISQNIIVNIDKIL